MRYLFSGRGRKASYRLFLFVSVLLLQVAVAAGDRPTAYGVPVEYWVSREDGLILVLPEGEHVPLQLDGQKVEAHVYIYPAAPPLPSFSLTETAFDILLNRQRARHHEYVQVAAANQKGSVTLRDCNGLISVTSPIGAEICADGMIFAQWAIPRLGKSEILEYFLPGEKKKARSVSIDLLRVFDDERFEIPGVNGFHRFAWGKSRIGIKLPEGQRGERLLGNREVQQNLAHELVHKVMSKHGGAANFPLWVEEGLANYMALELLFPDILRDNYYSDIWAGYNLEFTPGLFDMAINLRSLLGLKKERNTNDLLRMASQHPELVMRLYSMAFVFTKFLMEQLATGKDPAILRGAIAHIRDGTGGVVAQDLQAHWTEYLRGRSGHGFASVSTRGHLLKLLSELPVTPNETASVTEYIDDIVKENEPGFPRPGWWFSVKLASVAGQLAEIPRNHGDALPVGPSIYLLAPDGHDFYREYAFSLRGGSAEEQYHPFLGHFLAVKYYLESLSPTPLSRGSGIELMAMGSSDKALKAALNWCALGVRLQKFRQSDAAEQRRCIAETAETIVLMFKKKKVNMVLILPKEGFQEFLGRFRNR